MSILDCLKPAIVRPVKARVVHFPGGEQGTSQTMTTDERTRVQRIRNIEYGSRRRAEGRGSSGT